MSAPIRTEGGVETPTMFPDSAMMYAPPWARDALTEAADAALDASARFRGALPAAPQLGEPRARKREAPFEGDVVIKRLRERPSLDPVAVPAPPVERSSVGILARVFGAVGLAALAAFFMVGTAPFSLAVKAEGDGAPSIWSRFPFPASRPEPSIKLASSEPDAPVALAERFADAHAPAETPAATPVQTVTVAAITPEAAPSLAPVAAPAEQAIRAIDREEIDLLYKRGEQLMAEGDIAAARLMFARAAESGDARSALALGAAYDPQVLKKMGVLGVTADIEQARTWYERAAQSGSREAARRLEQLATR